MARRKLATAIVFAHYVALNSGNIVNANKFRAGVYRHYFSSSPSYFANTRKTTPAFCRTRDASRKTGNRMADIQFSGEMDDITIGSLLQRAQQVRENSYGASTLPPFILDSSQLSYPSSTYNMETDIGIRNSNRKKTVQRGCCNWLLPQAIMIGQYPGMTPENNGPSSKECQLHIQNMVQDANISLFCCLQTEVPSQEDEIGWRGGEVYLEPEYVRREFPRPFTRYGPLAQSFSDSQLSFLHNPIEDLSVPTCNDSLLSLLSRLLQHLESNDNGAIYLHCWGGRGRAGLIGSCLASLLFPDLSSKEILDWVQQGYNTRSGAENMPDALRKSPQTEHQRFFVKEFVNIVHTEIADKSW